MRYPNIDYTSCCSTSAQKTSFLDTCSAAQGASVTCTDVVAGSVIVTYSGDSTSISTITSTGATAFGNYNLAGATVVTDSDGAGSPFGATGLVTAALMATLASSVLLT